MLKAFLLGFQFSSAYQWNVRCEVTGARCRHSVTPEPSPESESMERLPGRAGPWRGAERRQAAEHSRNHHHCPSLGLGSAASSFSFLFQCDAAPRLHPDPTTINSLFKLPFVCDFCFYFLQGGGLCTRKLSLKRSEVQCHNNLLAIWYIFFTYTRGGFQ